MFGSSWLALSELKVNGPLYNTAIQGKSLAAHVVSPAGNLTEAYLEATLLARSPESLNTRADKLATLRRAYDERHQFWRGQNIPEEFRHALELVHEPAVSFWQAIESKLLPAVRSGRQADIESAFEAVTTLFTKHRAGIDAAMKIASDFSESVAAESASKERLYSAVVLGAGIAGIVTVVLVALGLLLHLVLPMLRLNAAMADVAGGALDKSIPAADRRDELGEMAASIAVLCDLGRLKAIAQADADRQRQDADRERAQREQDKVAADRRRVQAIQHVADQVENAARKSLTVVVGRMDAMTNLMRGLSASTGELRNDSDDVARAAEDALASMRQTSSTATALSKTIGEVAQKVQSGNVANAAAVDASKAVSDRISSLTQAITKIENFTTIINDIARNTNLLALNAGVEAARSGEHGLGFAVIAREVKALSEQTSLATSNISQLLAEIQLAKDGALDAASNIGGAIQHASSAAQVIGTALGEQISATQSIIRNIAQTERTVADVAKAIQNVASETQSAGARTQEADGICAAVTEQVHALQSELIKILRTSSKHVNRRSEPRRPDRQQVVIGDGPTRQTTVAIDISSSGIRVSGVFGSVGERRSLHLSSPAVSVKAEIVGAEDGATRFKFDQPISEAGASNARAA